MAEPTLVNVMRKKKYVYIYFFPLKIIFLRKKFFSKDVR